jgi:dihydroorotate dehydrogenase
MGILYKNIIRPYLFSQDPEEIHERISYWLKTVGHGPLASVAGWPLRFDSDLLKISAAGIEFKGPVGLAAGFDKSGELYPALSSFGFDFIESGTFTLHPQDGNPKPRIFRYPKYSALVNRMGFNNAGAESARELMSTQVHSIPRGINVGKSKIASLDDAKNDYIGSIKLLAQFGDYLTINISSPNTPDLRKLQEKRRLTNLIRAIMQSAPMKPVFIKVAPDLTDKEFEDILGIIVSENLAGVIVSNTTLDRSAAPDTKDQEGGLSGIPVRNKSTLLIRKAYRIFQGKKIIIGSGGIFNGSDAIEKIRAGASLIQIYTGYIYEGPGLPSLIKHSLHSSCKMHQCTLKDLIGSEGRSI